MIKLPLNCWQLAARSLQADTSCMLLYVLESLGSSPGRQGFFMVVNDNKEMCGSIGGGIMEHKLVELAWQRLKKKEPGNSLHRQVHDKSEGSQQSGMICSGEQTVFMYNILPSDLPAIAALISSLQDGKNGCLEIQPEGLGFSADVPAINYFYEADECGFMYREKTGFKDRLYIIGGGHCSLALSELMVGLGFFVEVFDEREGLKTMQENSCAHKMHVVESYNDLDLHPGDSSFVVIMTFGYRTDDVVVRRLWGKTFSYIGLLGSQHKIDTLKATYQQEGLDENWFAKIHAPAGVPIHSKSPAEIAVSIAAQIIAVKNKI